MNALRRAFRRARVALPQPWSRALGRAAYLPALATSAQTRRAFREEAAIAGAMHGKPLPANGAGLSERVVEVPWVLERIPRNAARVLDVGTAFAPPVYQQLLSRLPVGELHGVDLVPFELRNVRATVADIRSLPFDDATFDAAVCVSTIEHIGMDNEIYFDQSGRQIDEAGDVAALRELARVTAPGGRVLLTVPGGSERDFDWQRQYSPGRLERLAQAAGLSVDELACFEHHASSGWLPAEPRQVEARSYGEGAPAAAALICASLRR